MAFKNLEKRFNENVNKLYAGATSKFDNGVASNGKADAPLIVRKPGDGQVGIKLEGRSLPVVSAAQDLKRLTLFQLSKPGLLFLAKQQLLQSGNTFKFTRPINPAFVVANAIPFLHVKRNLRPFGELTGKTDTSYNNVKKMGTMQKESYDKLVKWKLPTYVSDYLTLEEGGSAAAKSKSGLLGKIGSAFKNLVAGKLKSSIGNKLSQAFSPLTPAISAVNPFLKRNIGEENSWAESRPELENKSVISYVNQANALYQRVHDLDDKKDQFIKYFSAGRATSNGKFPGGISGLSVGEETAGVTSVNRKNSIDAERKVFKQKISYITDPANENPANRKNSKAPKSLQEAYKPINQTFTDIINVSFAMGKDDAVQFRAFIKDLNQTATPEYKAYQYIGRMEKFINYVGVQREISFKLGIVAFGPAELETVWRRINYLTGLVFPYGFNKGIMQPNITRLTIGDVYVNQPGYVTSLSTNFTELGESWEIDAGRQVPLAAQMDIKFTLIEKATRIADSPFYGITDGGTSGKLMSGFSKEISVPKPKNKSVNSTTDAPTGDGPLDFRAARRQLLTGIPDKESLPYQPLPDTDPETGFNLYPPP